MSDGYVNEYIEEETNEELRAIPWYKRAWNWLKSFLWKNKLWIVIGIILTAIFSAIIGILAAISGIFIVNGIKKKQKTDQENKENEAKRQREKEEDNEKKRLENEEAEKKKRSENEEEEKKKKIIEEAREKYNKKLEEEKQKQKEIDKEIDIKKKKDLQEKLNKEINENKAEYAHYYLDAMDYTASHIMPFEPYFDSAYNFKIQLLENFQSEFYKPTNFEIEDLRNIRNLDTLIREFWKKKYLSLESLEIKECIIHEMIHQIYYNKYEYCNDVDNNDKDECYLDKEIIKIVFDKKNIITIDEFIKEIYKSSSDRLDNMDHSDQEYFKILYKKICKFGNIRKNIDDDEITLNDKIDIQNIMNLNNVLTKQERDIIINKFDMVENTINKNIFINYYIKNPNDRIIDGDFLGTIDRDEYNYDGMNLANFTKYEKNEIYKLGRTNNDLMLYSSKDYKDRILYFRGIMDNPTFKNDTNISSFAIKFLYMMLKDDVFNNYFIMNTNNQITEFHMYDIGGIYTYTKELYDKLAVTFAKYYYWIFKHNISIDNGDIEACLKNFINTDVLNEILKIK